MLRLWSRAAQAQSTCGCVSCLSTSAGGLASRTASAASKRRLRIGNSVTALYTSIFAAAALVDAQGKDQRRLEWKEKIAAVKEEVNELMDEERRLLEALASRQKPRLFNATFHARQSRPFQMTPELFSRRPGQLSLRCYHTETAAESLRGELNAESEMDDSLGPDTVKENTNLHSELSSEGTWDTVIPREFLGSALDDDTPDDLFVLPVGVQDMDTTTDPRESPLGRDERGFYHQKNTIPKWLAKDKARMKAIRIIALRQLALRFMLRPTIAHDYLGLRAAPDIGRSPPGLRTQQLLSELHKLRHRMYKLKTRRRANFEDLILRNDLVDEYKFSDVDRRIRKDVENYLCGVTSLDELLIKLAHSLSHALDPDRVVLGLKYMLLAFTRTRQTDLSELVLKAILPNKFPLNSSLVLAILSHNYKSKNLRGWEMFLDMLRGENFPVELGKLGLYKRHVVNGVDITIPPLSSTNAVVFSTLILGCLNLDQPDRANAYLSYARSVGYMDSFPTLNAYLKFYANRKDWPQGLQTMKRALAFIVSSTEHSESQLERLISLMVRFCDQCEAYDMSEALIAGAVNSGFDWQFAMKQKDLMFPTDLDYKRWEKARNTSSADMSKKLTCEKSHAFVNTISDKLNGLAEPDPESAHRWQKLSETYAQQVLSASVSGSRTEYKQAELTGQREIQQTSQPPDVDDQSSYSSYSQNIAQAHQREISSLKDEVSQLKRMVFELTQTASKNPTVAPEQVSSPTDLGQLKTQLSTTKTCSPESPAHITIEYLKS